VNHLEYEHADHTSANAFLCIHLAFFLLKSLYSCGQFNIVAARKINQVKSTTRNKNLADFFRRNRNFPENRNMPWVQNLKT
jgi:hypothetical protein